MPVPIFPTQQRQQAAIDRALAHHRAGRIEQAIEGYRGVLRTEPGNGLVLDYMAQALQMMCRLEEALYARERAVKAEPGNLFLRTHLANLLMDMGEPDKSVEVWRELVRMSGNNRQAQFWLARQLTNARRVSEALAEFERMIAADPEDYTTALECAVVNERMGNQKRARELVDAILAKSPDHPEANTALGRLLMNDGDLAAAKAQLERARGLAGRQLIGRVHTMLAQVLDKIKEHGAAFEEAATGQRLKFDLLPSQEKNFEVHERIAQMAQGITRAEVEAWPRPSDAGLPRGVPAAPVFIVGFPRSGTTLIEQMFAAHPNLTVSDELPNLQAVRQKMYADFRRSGKYPGDLGEFTPKQLSLGRKWYFERSYRTVPEAGGALDGRPKKRIVDKQPLNTVEMAFARLLFPESPMIYVQRDPRDTVVSVFMQGFDHAVPHLFSIEGTAKLYDMFARTWRHFEQVLGGAMTRLKYEDLVEDAEREVRRLIEFIGEPWDDVVLNYHAPEHRRMVTTPSYADVAKPVYKRAMGRWRKYEKQLAPVLPVLEPWVLEGGYEPSNIPGPG